MCTVCTEYMYSLCTVCTEHMYSVYTVCTEYMYSVCTEYMWMVHKVCINLPFYMDSIVHVFRWSYGITLWEICTLGEGFTHLFIHSLS